MIPKKLYISETEIDVFDEDTDIVRAWVANRLRNECMVEYTDLSQVWHQSEEEPEVGRQVLGIYYFDSKACSGVFENRFVAGIFMDDNLILAWDSVLIWAYIDDLLPKGGEE